jgi:hypothetical protein
MQQLFPANLGSLDLVIGWLLPLVIAVLNRPSFPKWARVLVMVGVAAVAGVIAAATQGVFNDFDWSNAGQLFTTIALIAALAHGFYEKFWLRIGVATAIEEKTSPTPATVTDDGTYNITNVTPVPADPAPTVVSEQPVSIPAPVQNDGIGTNQSV